MATKKQIIERIYSAFNNIDFSGDNYESVMEEREALVGWVKLNVKTYEDMFDEDEKYVKADLDEWLESEAMFAYYDEFEDYVYSYVEQVDGSMVLGTNDIRKICSSHLLRKYKINVDELD